MMHGVRAMMLEMMRVCDAKRDREVIMGLGNLLRCMVCERQCVVAVGN